MYFHMIGERSHLLDELPGLFECCVGVILDPPGHPLGAPRILPQLLQVGRAHEVAEVAVGLGLLPLLQGHVPVELVVEILVDEDAADALLVRGRLPSQNTFPTICYNL